MMVHKGLEEKQVCQDQWDHLDQEALKAHLAPKVYKVHAVPKEMTAGPVYLVPWVPLDPKVHLVFQDLLALKVIGESRAFKEMLEQREIQASMDDQELLVKWVHLAQLEKMAFLGRKVTLDHEVPPVSKVWLDLEDHKVLLESKANKDPKEMLDLLDNLDPPVFPEAKGPRVLSGNVVPSDNQAPWASLVHQALKERWDRKEIQDRLVLPASLEILVQMVFLEHRVHLAEAAYQERWVHVDLPDQKALLEKMDLQDQKVLQGRMANKAHLAHLEILAQEDPQASREKMDYQVHLVNLVKLALRDRKDLRDLQDHLDLVENVESLVKKVPWVSKDPLALQALKENLVWPDLQVPLVLLVTLVWTDLKVQEVNKGPRALEACKERRVILEKMEYLVKQAKMALQVFQDLLDSLVALVLRAKGEILDLWEELVQKAVAEPLVHQAAWEPLVCLDHLVQSEYLVCEEPKATEVFPERVEVLERRVLKVLLVKLVSLVLQAYSVPIVNFY